LSKKKAEKDLLKAGFKIGKIYYRQNEDLIPYTVLDQSIPAETVLGEPATVNLTVSVLDMQDIFNHMIDKGTQFPVTKFPEKPSIYSPP
jgi:hypothetical protein